VANQDHLAVLNQGVEAWNAWRLANPTAGEIDRPLDTLAREFSQTLVDALQGRPNAKKRYTVSGIDLRGADLSDRDLRGVNFARVHLEDANLYEANLAGADLSGAIMSGARLEGADLTNARAVNASLSSTNLKDATFEAADLTDAHFDEAFANLASFRGATLEHANLTKAALNMASMESAKLRGAKLSEATLWRAKLDGADLREADLSGASLRYASLPNAQLSNANLENAHLVGVDFTGADLRGCRVHGVSAWDLRLDDAHQHDLVITRSGQPAITVDDIEVAQFIYLLLNNEKIRAAIDTIGKKGVLLLGRFSDGRKAVLDLLRTELRRRDFIPMVFDFERPERSDFTETIRTLTGLSRFVIADITSPQSTPLELQATVPEFMVPFVPIIELGQEPFSMFQDLLVKHSAWVLTPIAYASPEELLRGLDTDIIEPALARSEELTAKKAEKLTIRRIGAAER